MAMVMESAALHSRLSSSVLFVVVARQTCASLIFPTSVQSIRVWEEDDPGQRLLVLHRWRRVRQLS